MRIVERTVDESGVVHRKLECGHTQIELGVSARATGVTDVACRVCLASNARQHIAPKPAPVVEPRSALQMAADALEAEYPFTRGRAWPKRDVLVRKLIDAARAHSCPKAVA